MTPKSSETRSYDNLQDSHEERIQSLEDDTKDALTQLAAIRPQLSFIGQTMEDGLNRVTEKIESLVTPMGAKIDRIETSMGAHSDQIRDLTQDHQQRKERKGVYKKLLLGFGLAVGGVIAKEVTVFLWHRIFGG